MAYDQGTFAASLAGFLCSFRSIQDDATALDMPTMHRWNLILRVFTLEYLGLPPPGSASLGKRSVDEDQHTRHHELVSGRAASTCWTPSWLIVRLRYSSCR